MAQFKNVLVEYSQVLICSGFPLKSENCLGYLQIQNHTSFVQKWVIWIENIFVSKINLLHLKNCIEKKHLHFDFEKQIVRIVWKVSFNNLEENNPLQVQFWVSGSVHQAKNFFILTYVLIWNAELQQLWNHWSLQGRNRSCQIDMPDSLKL